ncbi:MAG: HD domain-containing protein [Victivallaceae bacterium]|nr:HD domain-containing protein [Victivallaceae bacterium]
MESLYAILKLAAEPWRSGNPEIDAFIDLKLEHSARVAEIGGQIAAGEHFPADIMDAANCACMFHDISRFMQYRHHRSFDDRLSFDHGDMSAEILKDAGILDFLAPDDRRDVITAVRLHNKRTLPSELTKHARLLAKLTRDADKLDIMAIFTAQAVENGSADTIGFSLGSERLMSPNILESLAARRCPSYGDIVNACDFWLVRIGWVYDLSFDTSVSIFRERKYLDFLEQELDGIPGADKPLRDAKNYIVSHVGANV